MAFWGIEVKPGKTVTHSLDKVRRRLRISQATLGIGSVMKKSLVQCNVGNRSPVFLCALLPDKTESCHLDLEFEEPDDVVFSVIGSRSVYLTGYYVSDSRHSVLGSDTETYGEDIANTDTEESGYHTDEDKYEDSFIDDDDPEVFPPSPVSSDQADEKMPGKNKMREQKGIRKLQRKRIQVIDSDHDSTSRESGDEDNFVLSAFKFNKAAKTTVSEVTEKNGQGTVATAGNKADCGTSDCVSNEKPDDLMMHREAKRKNLQGNVLVPSNEVKSEKEIEPKESWKDLAKEAETLEDNFVNHSDGLVDDKSQGKDGMVDNSGNLVAHGEDKRLQGHGNTSSTLVACVSVSDALEGVGDGSGPTLAVEFLSTSFLPSSEPGSVSKKKSKRKRKEQFHEVKSLGGGSGNHGKALKEDEALQIEAEADSRPQDLLQSDKDAQKPTVDGYFIGSGLLLPPAEVSSGDDQNPKKRRKGGTGEKSVRSNNGTCSNILVEDHCKQQVLEASKMNKDLPATTEEYKKPTADRASDPVAEGCKLEKVKKKKKKSKKSKAPEIDANFNTSVSILSENENRKSPMKLEERNYENRTSQARTLSNGLTIEELASGEKDGKVATLGRKVKVFYTAKLKNSGHVFDSNIGKAPYKFRLGDESVIEGWNVGLEGMRVGEKRRLIIPPSMGFGRQGAGENMPPNSWLVYEVELAGAR